MPVETRQFEHQNQIISYRILGKETATRQFVWAHGWGQNHSVFLPLVESCRTNAQSILIDLPGFGNSPKPSTDWGTAEFADSCANLLASLPRINRIWIGHSFGCRIGLQLAARHSNSIDALFLIAAAGLRRKRSPLTALKFKSKIILFKILNSLPINEMKNLREKFGSADYRAAGEMRGILTKVVNEDLSNIARKTHCPVHLVYGSEDKETPPEMGQRLANLVSNGQYVCLEGLDHYSVLGSGRHQTAFQLKKFVNSMENVT